MKRFDLKPMLQPKSVAVIGASRSPDKVGHVILQNYIDAGYSGKIFPINPSADEILGIKAFKSVLEVKEDIDLAVIAIPAELVPDALEQCGKAKVKGVIVVSGGFSEVGRDDLQKRIVKIADKFKMPMIGPNCLGVMNPRVRSDTLFLPTYKLAKPKIGSVSFVAQSGAVGSTVLDLIAKEGFGLSKFISYGNAAQVDEVDILEYLLEDKETQVIIMYIEGIKRGKDFIEIAKKITKKKPVVIIKGGMTQQGSMAAHSHTAALAGDHQAYEAVFRQFGFTVAGDLSDLLYYAKIFATQPLPSGDRVAIITNGGGTGVLTTDAVYESNLKLADFSKSTQKDLRKALPSMISIRNPLDLVGDADEQRYRIAVDAILKDPNVDMLIVIALFQTPGADSKVAATLISYKHNTTKPMLVISIGSDYTQMHKIMMENEGLPVYDSPLSATNSFAELLKYKKYLDK